MPVDGSTVPVLNTYETELVCIVNAFSARPVSRVYQADVMVVLVIHTSTALNAAAAAHGCLLVLSGSEHLLRHER